MFFQGSNSFHSENDAKPTWRLRPVNGIHRAAQCCNYIATSNRSWSRSQVVRKCGIIKFAQRSYHNAKAFLLFYFYSYVFVVLQ
jgi:hypothetical protein